jgi:hypothetical protein
MGDINCMKTEMNYVVSWSEKDTFSGVTMLMHRDFVSLNDAENFSKTLPVAFEINRIIDCQWHPSKGFSTTNTL